MTTNGVSSGVSSSEYNKFYAIPFGLGLTAISLASVNFKNEMIETASSIAKEIFGAWTQHTLAVLGTTAGTFSILQTFSKPSEATKNLTISALASTCLVAIFKNAKDPVLPFIFLPGAAILIGLYKYHAYYEHLVVEAEAGNQEAIAKVLKSVDFFATTATSNLKERAGKVLFAQINKLYSSDDQKSKDAALGILAACFAGGINVSKNENAAMLCLNRINTVEAKNCVIAHNETWWKERVKMDPAAEKLIDLCLGRKEKNQ